MKQKQLALVSIVCVAIVLIAILVVTNWPDGGGPVGKMVRFGTGGNAVDYGPYIVAKHHGWFAEALDKHGYKVAHTAFDSAPTINESYATGRVDAVFVAVPPVLVGRSAGVDVRIVGISCSLTQDVLVPTESDVKAVEDLTGKKIALLKGSSSHYAVHKIIQDAGLTASDIQIIDMLPPDARNAFETGRVDAWAVWPPWVEQLQLAGQGRVLSGGGVKIYSIVSVRGEFADESPNLVKEILRVVDRAKQWIANNPEEAKAIVARELGVSEEVINMAWPRHNFAAQITDEIIDDIQARAHFLFDGGFIENKVDVRAGFIDTSLRE